MASLFVIQGRDQGARYELDSEQDAFTIGRDAGNSIQLHDTEVSRRHAEIRRIGEAYSLTDLSSSNGTFVNGKKADQWDLNSGDQVQVGRTFLLFTGVGDLAATNLVEQVDIVARSAVGENSRIIRSVTQQEGQDFLRLSSEPSNSPWLARARSNLQIMYRTALAVSHTLDIDQLLRRIMELIFEWVEADRGCIMLVDHETHELMPKVRRTRQGLPTDDKISISRTILDYVMDRKEGVLTSDAREDDRWDTAASILQLGVREAICVPMQGRYDIVGVIYIDTFTPSHRVISHGGANRFHEEHLKLMVAIAHQAALAVEDTSYYSAMVQSERLAAVGQTITTLSHHIKNILQGIRGGSYLIDLGLSEHDESVVRKGWDIVERNQKRISTLVMDMLTFSKEREPELAPADLNRVVADVVELMQSRAEELRMQVVFTPAEDMPTLLFDAESIHRAVLNVVTNALDACGPAEPGRVQITTHYFPEPGQAQIIVEDNGVGIAPDDLNKIFTLFVSQKGSRGTGLGLPVSQKIMKEHGGQIRVESEPGQGSKFTLEMPAVLPDSPRETGVAEQPLSGKTAAT